MTVKSLSPVRLFVTPWTVAYQAPLPMGFSRQEYWSGVPFPSPGDLPNPGIEPRSPALQADTLLSEPPGKSSILRGESKYSSVPPGRAGSHLGSVITNRTEESFDSPTPRAQGHSTYPDN